LYKLGIDTYLSFIHADFVLYIYMTVVIGFISNPCGSTEQLRKTDQ